MTILCQQPSAKSVNYVQISAETYNHLTELEDQVKVLNEKLTSAQSEITNKDVLVKQHAKVAEEAVTGSHIKFCYIPCTMKS